MSKYTKTLISAVATAALIAPAALAQSSQPSDADVEFINQVQLGNVWSNVDVYVENSDTDVITNSLAIANASTAINERGDLTVSTNQLQRGAVEANTNISAGFVGRDVVGTTNATGNSAYAGNWYGDSYVDITQASRENVTATSRVDANNVLCLLYTS